MKELMICYLVYNIGTYLYYCYYYHQATFYYYYFSIFTQAISVFIFVIYFNSLFIITYDHYNYYNKFSQNIVQMHYYYYYDNIIIKLIISYQSRHQ